MSLKFCIWNVQHGSAAYIQSPNGKHIAIDLGAGLDGGVLFSPLQALQNMGITKLDHVTITHPHLDHIDDILNFDAMSPTTVLLPKHLTEYDIRGGNPPPIGDADAKIRKYLDIAGRYIGDAYSWDNLCIPANWGGVSIQSFASSQSPVSNLNNQSIVTVLDYAGIKILVPGDNEAGSWAELLERTDFVNAISGAQIFVASHHGRESGFYRPLFNHIAPWVTVISDGPVVNTSVTDKYTDLTVGHCVRRRHGDPVYRKCVTTRNDGLIFIEITPTFSGVTTVDVTVD